MDLRCVEGAVLEPNVPMAVPTGLAIELPPGYEAQVRPRSGLALKHGISLANTPGTIDPGYRGEIKVVLVNLDPREPIVLARGDRIAQLVVQRVDRAAFAEVAELPESIRGAGGFGSTGGYGGGGEGGTDGVPTSSG